jgi:hypothetical protein
MNSQRKRVLELMWIAMVLALGGYWMICLMVANRIPKPPGTPLIGRMFILISLVTYSLACLWFRWTLDGVASHCQPGRLKRLSVEERDQLQLRLQSTVILCMAFLEAPAIYGLIHGFLSPEYPGLFEMLASTSLLGMVILRARGFSIVYALMDRLEEPAAALLEEPQPTQVPGQAAEQG